MPPDPKQSPPSRRLPTRVEPNCDALDKLNELRAQRNIYPSGVVRRTLAGSRLRNSHFLRKPCATGILSEIECECAKYSCSGQVREAQILILPTFAIHDLGFYEQTSAQTVPFGVANTPKVPRTGIFCTLKQKIRQHASWEAEKPAPHPRNILICRQRTQNSNRKPSPTTAAHKKSEAHVAPQIRKLNC